MGTTYMSAMVNPQVMGDMINAKIEALLKITPYAKIDTTLQGVPGDTKTVPSWNYIGDASDVAEGVEVGLTEMTKDTTTFTIKKAMKAVGLTQEAINSGYGDPMGTAETQLAKSVAGKVDQDVFDSALKATLTFEDSANTLKYANIVDTIDKFEEEEITDKVMFIHPSQVTKLRKDSEFIEKSKYGNEVMVSGEIGMVAGARIVPSKKVQKVGYTKSASGVSGALLIVAEDDTPESGESKLSSLTAGAFWDETNKKIFTPAVGDYVLALSVPEYFCPMLKLEPASAETEYTETELPAITIFLKKDTQTDAEWKPRTQTHEITTAKYYGVALTNAAKVALAKIKA